MPSITSRLRSNLAIIEAAAGRNQQAARRLLEVIEHDAATGGWFSAWSWTHRLVRVFARAGRSEDAVTLHHAIPPGRGLILVGDEPVDVLLTAQGELGAERYAELAAAGARLRPDQLVAWIRQAVETLQSNETT